MGKFSIVGVIMKFISLLLLIFLVSGCLSPREIILPSDRIVPFLVGEKSIGYGVRLEGGNILTATHVIEDCKKWNCTFSGESLSGIYKSSYADATVIGKIEPILDRKKLRVQKDDAIYLLRFLSGGLRRFDTTITAIDVSYVGFDGSLSGMYSTGGIEIGLMLEKGESGLPVWTLSGELIGVVSATNTVAGKSYIVQ